MLSRLNGNRWDRALGCFCGMADPVEEAGEGVTRSRGAGVGETRFDPQVTGRRFRPETTLRRRQGQTPDVGKTGPRIRTTRQAGPGLLLELEEGHGSPGAGGLDEDPAGRATMCSYPSLPFSGEAGADTPTATPWSGRLWDATDRASESPVQTLFGDSASEAGMRAAGTELQPPRPHSVGCGTQGSVATAGAREPRWAMGPMF